MKGKEQRKPKRITLTLWWWLGQVMGWGLIIPIFHIGGGGEPLPIWFWGVFVVVLLIQGIIHWKLLMKHYPEKRKNNIWLIATMPIFIFFGLWVAQLFESVLVGIAIG